MENLKIGEKITKVPLIQGGMGVGISLGRLAGSVAKAGGIGVISTAQMDIGNRILINIRRRPTFVRLEKKCKKHVKFQKTESSDITL